MTSRHALGRRDLMRVFPAAALAAIARPVLGEAASEPRARAFPRSFLWGVASAGHQVEGNNVNSDAWLLEQVKPTLFQTPSGDACDSFNRWQEDLDLVRGMGLNCYRFSLEWARIEPAQGQFSKVMLDHYRAILAGCRARGLTPLVTYNHFSAPRWFAAQGGWEVPAAPDHFVRYCERVTKHMGGEIEIATTLNEPNLLRLLRWLLPPDFLKAQDAMLAAAAKACGSTRFSAANAGNAQAMLAPMIAGHQKAFEAIKSIRPELKLGVSLALSDDQAVGPGSRVEEKRADVYGAWLHAAKQADFVGVQVYERQRLDKNGGLPPPEDAIRGQTGQEYYPAALANAVRYVHGVVGKPVLVTENGFATGDDALRQRYLIEALGGLGELVESGVPVLGYVHWSLLDCYEWVAGNGIQFGLVAVDRESFKRTPKPSARLYGAIAKRRDVRGIKV